ncbi:reverse transcriptase [Trichonephila clavipes]|nr:reverse transcriptase [Trichonephila clavipes]
MSSERDETYVSYEAKVLGLVGRCLKISLHTVTPSCQSVWGISVLYSLSLSNGGHSYTFGPTVSPHGWTVALQWVPSHVGIPGNERANQKAKQGAESSQLEDLLTLRKAKSIISTFIGNYTIVTQNPKKLGKLWETLATVGPIPRQLERVEADARFRITTAHDFLEAYLHWLSLAANEACPLCGHDRMDGDHLLQCTGLDKYPTNDIVSRYWKTRRQMVKKPSTGVG